MYSESRSLLDGDEHFKDFELHTIELRRFDKDRYENLSDLLERIKKPLDMWSAFLTKYYLLDKNNLPEELNDKYLKKALNVLDVMNFNDIERLIYEDHLKWRRIDHSGLEMIRAEGKLEVASKLLDIGMAIPEIMKVTGLSMDEIGRLEDFRSS